MFSSLTSKEIEVCEEFIKTKGIKNCAHIIAKNMFVEVSTIKTHIVSIYQKLLVNNQAELMYFLLTNIAHLDNLTKK